MATYTFTGQCYSQSGDTKKYESSLWQGVSYTESTVGGVTGTQLTRSDTDPTNYTYTITYLPDNIDNGTEVTVSGSSIYAGVSKSFAFSFTGTKSTIKTAYFPIRFVITDSYGEPIQSEISHGKITISTGLIKIKGDYVDKFDLSLSNGDFYGYYECEYDSSDTDEYVCIINDFIDIGVNQMYPSTFGSDHYVGFSLALDYALSDNSLDETITIHSKINSDTGTWDPGTARLLYAGLLGVKVDINNINTSKGGLSEQCWTNEIDETFDSPFIGYIIDTTNMVKAKLVLTFNIVT